MDKHCFGLEVIQKPFLSTQQAMFQHQPQVFLHLRETIKHSNGDPERIEGSKEKIRRRVDRNKAKGRQIIEIQLIRNEYAQICDSKYGHEMRHPPQKEQITESFKSTLAQHIILIETADVFYQLIQRLNSFEHWRFLTDCHLHSMLQVPYFQFIDLVPEDPPEDQPGNYQSCIQPEERADELSNRDGVVLDIEDGPGCCKAGIAHNNNRMEEKMKIPGHIVERRKELERKLVESGEMERLEEYLRKKLVASGWKENLKTYCKDLVREKGIEKVTVQSLVDELETRGKHTIPVTIREDLLSRVRKFLEQNK